MTAKKRRKTSRQLGSRTHGWGRSHRGKGEKGGKGNAGTGKRAQSKKPKVWGTKYMGRHGFLARGAKKNILKLSIKDIENRAEKFLLNNLAEKKQDIIFIDLSKLGYGKLLSQGSPTRKYSLIISSASAKAVEKIKSAGGEVKISSD